MDDLKTLAVKKELNLTEKYSKTAVLHEFLPCSPVLQTAARILTEMFEKTDSTAPVHDEDTL